MREEECEVALKLVVVGNGAVGKSSMIQRFCKGIFTKDYKKTIGVDFLERELEMDGQDIRLMLWDTAGQEEFDAITKAYYRGAQACVLAYSATDRISFNAVETWKSKVENEVGDIAMVLVQNKIDLTEQTTVTEEEAEALAKKLKVRLYRTSVKDNINIDSVFQYLVKRYLTVLEQTVTETPPQQVISRNFLLHQSNQRETHGSSKAAGTELTEMQHDEMSQSPSLTHLKSKKKEKCSIT